MKARDERVALMNEVCLPIPYFYILGLVLVRLFEIGTGRNPDAQGMLGLNNRCGDYVNGCR